MLKSVKEITCKDTGEKVNTYRDYLKTDHWHHVKMRMRLSRYPICCYVCAVTTDLELHHKTYKRLGDEKLNDLIWMCRTHHGMAHRVLNQGHSTLWEISRRMRKAHAKQSKKSPYSSFQSEHHKKTTEKQWAEQVVIKQQKKSNKATKLKNMQQ